MTLTPTRENKDSSERNFNTSPFSAINHSSDHYSHIVPILVVTGAK